MNDVVVMVERNRRNNLTANFSVTKDQCSNYDLAGIGIGLKQQSGLRDWGKILSGMAGLKNPIGDPLSWFGWKEYNIRNN